MPKAIGGGWAQPVVVKTGDYTVAQSDCGKLFTNTGASGAVVFTVPTSLPIGWWAEFMNTAAQTIAISSSPADKLVVHNDAVADTITTASTVGQHLKAIVVDGGKVAVVSNPSAASAATAVTAVTLAT